MTSVVFPYLKMMLHGTTRNGDSRLLYNRVWNDFSHSRRVARFLIRLRDSHHKVTDILQVDECNMPTNDFSHNTSSYTSESV